VAALAARGDHITFLFTEERDIVRLMRGFLAN